MIDTCNLSCVLQCVSVNPFNSILLTILDCATFLAVPRFNFLRSIQVVAGQDCTKLRRTHHLLLLTGFCHCPTEDYRGPKTGALKYLLSLSISLHPCIKSFIFVLPKKKKKKMVNLHFVQMASILPDRLQNMIHMRWELKLVTGNHAV